VIASHNFSFVFRARLFNDALQDISTSIVSFALAQAIFKDTREGLLRVGTMRFADYIVTERPMPPSRPLLCSNNRYSLSFRFGIDVQSQPSDDVHSTSIISSSALLIDSRTSDGALSVFQSTPSGATATHMQLILQVIAFLQAKPVRSILTRFQVTLQAKSFCSMFCWTQKHSHAPFPARWASAYVLLWPPII
jgi:hypothetical protein